MTGCGPISCLFRTGLEYTKRSAAPNYSQKQYALPLQKEKSKNPNPPRTPSQKYSYKEEKKKKYVFQIINAPGADPI
jgi:hypothetical protein